MRSYQNFGEISTVAESKAKEHQTENRQFGIDVVYYAVDGTWVATSADIKGLVVEAETFESFLSVLIEISNRLLAHNHNLSDTEIEASSIRVARMSIVRESQLPEQCPKLIVDESTQLAIAA